MKISTASASSLFSSCDCDKVTLQVRNRPVLLLRKTLPVVTSGSELSEEFELFGGKDVLYLFDAEMGFSQ